MLDQYRKEFPIEDKDKDLLPDSESSFGKRKLLFVLSGAAFALVFFLFLMGMFRSDDEQLAQKDPQPEAAQESLVSLDSKLQMILARLDKLEQEQTKSAATQTLPVKAPEQIAKQEFMDMSSSDDVKSAIALSTPEEAIAMTNQALRDFIDKSAVQPAKIAEEAAKQEKDAQAKLAKGKDKKATKVAARQKTTTPPSTYVIQKGDTLSKISLRCYGTAHRWKAIYEANRDKINNINQLKVGVALVIPQDSKQ